MNNKAKHFLRFFLLLAAITVPAAKMAFRAEASALGVLNTVNPVNVGDDLPMSRALVAKMLAMTFGDLNSIDTLDRYIEFSDTSPDLWYDKYINSVYVSGLMLGYGGLFMPEQPVTLNHAQILLDKLDENNTIKLQMTDQNKDMAISYALWTELYVKLLKNLSGSLSIYDYFGITERSITVLATPGNNARLSGFNLISDTGPLTFTGLRMDAYIDKEIRVLEKNGDILAVLTVENLEPTIRNAYIVSNDAERITIFTGGTERTYSYDGLSGDHSGGVCDITISGAKAVNITVISEKFKDRIMSSTQTEIEFKNKGTVPVGDNFKVYSNASGPVFWKKLSDLIVGTDLAEYVVKDGRICAAVITERPPFETLRVAIGDTGFRSLYHTNVVMSGTKPVTVSYGSNTKVFDAGERIIISDDFFNGNKRIYITPEDGGRIELNSIARSWPENETLSYGGSFEISKEAGGYVIVNIINAEEYLYTVVPSEMPTSYGIEALKAQAVSARSYAYNQFYENRFHKYGANIDDSVSCQVYNNIPANEASISAVESTRGLCVAYGDAVINANFFSTSGGTTANGGEVWADGVTKQFPTATAKYLIAGKQYQSEDFGDLRNEENAAAFFKATDITGYDSNYNWFRWTTEMTAQEIGASVNANLKARYEANPLLIKTLVDGKFFRSSPVESIGDFVDMEIMSRGEGGNIMSMKITGTEATVLVLTEYNIRALIRPYQYASGGRKIPLTLKDGSVLDNYSIMPSAFYVIEKQSDESGKVYNIKIFGGGMGHGAGMSQNGAKGMIDKGFSYDEVLKHFFSGAEIVKK